jgi:hypothetical protein
MIASKFDEYRADAAQSTDFDHGTCPRVKYIPVNIFPTALALFGTSR